MGSQFVSFVERFIILCPYFLGEPAIGGATVCTTVTLTFIFT